MFNIAHASHIDIEFLPGCTTLDDPGALQGCMVTAAAGLSAGNRMGCSDLASRSCWDICGSSTGLQPPSRYQNTPSCLQPPSSQEFVDESQRHYESCACLWWITQITTKLHLLCLCNFSQKKKPSDPREAQGPDHVRRSLVGAYLRRLQLSSLLAAAVCCGCGQLRPPWNWQSSGRSSCQEL